MEWLLDPQIWLALITLTALEIVLGVDNIIFISIMVSKLPKHHRRRRDLRGLDWPCSSGWHCWLR
jgi:predicted tellurium resistance membrane protein TerC